MLIRLLLAVSRWYHAYQDRHQPAIPVRSEWRLEEPK